LDDSLVALAPDIITPVQPETSRCVAAEMIEKGDKLSIIGMPTPTKWRTPEGLSLWKDVLEREGIQNEYVSIEELVKNSNTL
jgi:DUF917 family protein